MPVDPSLLRNPSNRKLFESQINDIEAARRADADLVESVAGQEQRQQAQQQREAQTAANVQAETNFKNAGRPYYKDEAGRIVPEQNDADWQASQQKANEQANLELQWKKEGRRYAKNTHDGSLVALDTDEVLAARQQAEGEEIRKRGLTDQMKAITAESGLSRKPLSTTEREKAEKALKKARQEGIYSITGKLGEASKQTDKAGWWDVVNNNPTEAATAAQKRLDRLSAPDADLDDDDLTDLDGNEATKPLAERIRSGRQMLADDDAARQSAESTRQKLADLKLRRDAPDRWAQIQRERVAGMDMPTLQKHAAASSDSLKTRMADFESRAQTVQQEVGQWDTALKALQAENEQARSRGIPASEMVTMSDGSTWHKPLALKLGEVQAKAQAWESDPMVQQRQKALAVEAKELQGEIALHNETVAAANAKRQAEQDQQFARLAEIPALAGHGAFLQSLVQEQATRRAALDQRFPEGPDTSPEAQAAYAALDADYQTRLAPVQQALEEGDRATAAAVGRAYDMVTQAEARGTNVDQAIAALQKETRVSPEKARSMLGDAAKTDWTRGPAEASRVLSDGRVIVRPNLWTNEAGYRKAVESANASPGAKESALAQFPALREQSAEQQITALQTLTPFRDWQAKQKPGMSAVETVERFSREHGWWRSQRDQLLTGLGQGVIGIMQAGVGAWEWLTGDASSADVYSRLDRDAQRLAGASQALPAGQWTALGASLGVGSLPSLAIGGPIGAGLMRAGMGGAAALGILPRAAGAAKGVLTTAQATNLASGLQMAGVAGVAGVQTFGQVFGEAVQSYQSQGYDLETAQQKAALPAFASGASTMILTALGGFQGTEALARLAKDQGVKKTLGQYAKAVFGGGLKEGALEELPDQLIQSAIAVASYDPNRPMEQILEEAMVALIGGGAMGGAFTALVEAPNVSLSAQAATPAVNTANLPETIAAAETAIDGYTNTALDPDTLARTQATARTLLYVAQGDIDSLPDSDLALVGVGRNAKGELENVATPDGSSPRVKIEAGQPIITQTTLDKLEKEMPAVRAAIPLDEASRRQANTTPPPNEQTTSPGNPPITATPVHSGSTPSGQSQQPGNPPGSAGGTSGTQTGSQPQELTELTEHAAERAEQIAVHLAERGLTEPQARAAARAIVAEQGIVGAEYSEQVTQQAFDDAMGRQGWVRGSGRKYQWIPPTDNAVPSEATQPISPGKPGAGSQATPEASGRSGQGPASPAAGGEGDTQGAAGATPASAAPAGGMDTDAFVEARRKAIAATPPDKRRGAVKLLGSLEKALTRYGSAFDGVRFAAKDGSGLNLAGGGLVVQREQGKVFLDVDLARWADQHAGLVDKAGVVATTEVEEEFIHRAAVNVIPDADMLAFWRSLPAALQEAVYQGYHAVDIQHGTLPAKAPSKFEDGQSVHLGHEFLRMLVQDSQFGGRVSEAIAVDPGLGEKIIALLKKLADRLRKLIDSAPTDVRVNVREYEAKVTKEVQRLRKSLPDALKAKETQPGQGMATAADNRTAVVKAGSTALLPRTNFAPTEGATGTAHTDSNDAIEYRWAVVDVSSLNISNADDGRINPDYPQELQPRDRTSAGSEAQVADIARNMNLDRLSQASGVGDGAPIVGPDGVVESGNGRVMGMRRAHTQGSKAAQAYAEKLAATAATYGLTAEQVKAVKHPVLVRVRTTDVDRVAFVLSANVSTIAPKREIEQAKIDAKQIVPDLFASFVPSEDGDVFTAANADFLRGYVSAIIPPAERPSIIDAKGNLTQTGLRRIRNALFVHAYGDSPESLNALARLTESIDSSGTNIASALVAAAPRFAEQNSRIAAGALYPLSITGDLAQTVQTLQDLRGRGEKVRDFLDQDRIPGIGDDPSPMQKELLQFLDEHAGRPRAIVDAFNRYASAVDGAGDPKQASLFGDEPRPTTLELWRLASRPASLGKGTVGADSITPQNALRVYRRLKKMEAEQGTLSGTQSQALERAERALGQLFMFDDTERVSRAYTLEQENAAPSGLNAEQLMLFKAAVRSMASPAEIEELSTNLRHLSSADGYVRRLDPADSQGLNVVRFYGPARRRIVKKVWDMLDNSYRAIGNPYKSQDHLMQDDAQTAFWDVVMHQGTPVAYSVLKVTPWGYKTVSSGQDGSEAGKAAWKTYFARLNKPGYYAELSGAPSAIAQKKDFPRVPVQQVQNILGKSVTPVDEYTYERRIAGLPVAHKKSIFGLPWLTPQSRPALPSSSSRTNSTGPATPPSVSASRTISTTSPDLSGTGTDSTISLAAGRRRGNDTGTGDLFAFGASNQNLNLTPLLSPQQQQTKREQAVQLDLFGTQPAPPASKPESADYATQAKGLADRIYQTITGNAGAKKLTWEQLFSMADEAFGGTQAAGTYSVKDAYDALEMALNRHIVESFDPSSAGTPAEAQSMVTRLKEILSTVPTQTKRTEETDALQQFSTVPPLAFMANWVADVKKADTYLEPSAGVGGLASFAKAAGAQVVANELSPRRASLLKASGIADQVFQEDAEQINNVLPQSVQPTVVVMNPPFSTSARGGKDTANAIKHIESALARLPDGGRLVAIVGEGMAMDRPAFRSWWQKMREKHHVRANIQVNGAEYAKYGTTWDNQLVVIDKVQAPVGDSLLTGRVDKIDELPALLYPLRNDRPRLSESVQGAPGRGGSKSLTDSSGSSQPSGRPSGSTADAGPALAGDSGPGLAGTAGNGDVTPGSSTDGSGVDSAPAGDSGEAGRPGRAQDGGNADRGAGLDTAAPSRTDVRSTEEMTEAVYDAYHPRVTFPGAKMPPTNLAESAAMAAVEPPAVKYRPSIPTQYYADPARGDFDQRLSAHALEAVALAGHAHGQTIPATTLAPQEREEWQKRFKSPPPDHYRRGFFIGDGTGAGKGRQIAAIVLDNWNQGRKRAVWVSEPNLYNDAKRDLNDVADMGDKLFEINATKAGEALGRSQGIGFISYSTLRSQEQKPKPGVLPKTRVDQIVEWLGADFDGVIAFDEAHNMGSAMPSKGNRGMKEASRQALAGLELQQRLPMARVLYLSATGATEVSNLAYAERLGLWGPGTPFQDRARFVNEIAAGGVAAMELIAQNLKAMGLYVARSISWHDVSYDRVPHALTREQRQIYDDLAEGWQLVLSNMDEAMKLTGITGDDPEDGTIVTKNGAAKSALRSKFWGSHQRFFNQLITAMKLPTVIRSIEKELGNGRSIVIQLVNTQEASLGRAISNATAAAANAGEEVDLESLDLSPRDQLLQLVQNGFPIIQMEDFTYQDSQGNTITSSKPVLDSKGNPVINQEAVKMRDRLLDRLSSIKVPSGPLEMLLDHFGAEKVAEVTGRTRRVVWKKDSEGRTVRAIEKRTPENGKREATDFQNGARRILVFSKAGGTGRSFHADRRAKNQEKRVHILLQPGWQASAAVQGFGRTHRNNQIVPPHYLLAETDIVGEKRFMSSIARRLDQLGALTKGQRQTGSQGFFQARDNLESLEAKAALDQFYQDILGGRVQNLTADVLEQEMGLKLRSKDGAVLDQLPPITQFLNRLLSLTLDTQNAVFEAFSERLDRIIETKISDGTLDQGLENLSALRTVESKRETVYDDPASGAKAELVTLTLTQPTDRTSHAVIRRLVGFSEQVYPWVRSKRTKKLFGLTARKNTTLADGSVVDSFRVQGVTRAEWVPVSSLWNRYDRIMERADSPDVRAEWENQYAEAPATEDETVSILTGTMLPIWDKVPGHPRIVRAQTEDGKRMIGRVIPDDMVSGMVTELTGKVTSQTTAAAIKQADNGQRVRLSNGWTLKTSRVSGEPRYELTGPSLTDHVLLDDAGVIRERIQFSMRYFLPSGSAEPVLSKVLSSFRASIGDPVPLSSGTKAPQAVFYSQLSRVVAQKMPARASASDIRAIVTNSQNGVKQEELKWSGLLTWLEGASGPLNKAEVLSYLENEGRVTLTETRLSQEPEHKDTARIVSQLAKNGYSVEVREEEMGNRIYKVPVLLHDGEDVDPFLEPKRVQNLFMAWQKANAQTGKDPTRYSGYTLPGGSNYREVVLTLPAKFDSDRLDDLRETSPRSAAQESEFQSLLAREGAAPRADRYVSSHFENISNYLAHYRANDRADRNGRPGMFLEELQSDRHQMGRDKGYREDKEQKLAQLVAQRDTMPDGPEKQAVQTEINALGAGHPGVPDAPFRVSWPLALFKRALAEAVASGKQWIGWTTGTTQNDRYNLSKQIKELHYRQHSNGNYDLVVITHEGIDENLGPDEITPADLSDYIGKELAQKVLKGEGKESDTEEWDMDSGYRFLGGLDLEVGGSGMTGFYDTMLPKEIGKYVRQWGGKVERTTIPEDEIWKLDITPEMQRGVSAGIALFSGTKASQLATSTKSVYDSGDDEPGRPGRGIRPVDRWTSGPTSITGSRVTREQGQRIGAVWRSWAKSGLRQSAFDWTPGPDLAQRLAAAFPGVPVLTPAQFNVLSNLPVIGSGFESEVHADRVGGAVYKILNNTGSSGAGIWNEVGWTSLGRLDWTYKPATRPRHFGIRMALQNLMGGTPTELAGISPGGLLILKQPLSPDAEAGEAGNLFQARREIGIIDVPPSMIYEPGYRAGVVVVEGRPYLVTDIKPDNFVGDNQGDIRFNDAIFGRLTAQVVSKVPGLASVVRQAAAEAQRLGDRSARLFKSTVSASSAGDASPMARLGWNHLDRAVSAKLAAHARWMNEKTGAGETVARWAGAENAKPFIALARVLKRELFPDSVLPREIAARKREMEIKTALGAQRAMDLVRALSNAPKFSDMAYPPEFSNNPAHRRDLYLAMAREKAMSSLPQPMQDLAKRLRDMLLEMGREAVKQGRMSLDTFAALQDGYMPHYYKEDVQREKSLFHRFRLGLRDILAQRTTAWHIVDHSSKDSSGQPRIVSWQGNQWRFRNEGHRDAFYEDFILQQALEQITNRNGKANRNLTLSDLRAPAKLPPETRGRLKEILRALRSQYTKEKPLTVEEQEKAGLIMDPVYAIARYTAQMVHDNSTAEFFNFVAGNPDWVSSNATPGFTEIPDNPRFGRLAGKYVTDDVARQLLEMVEAPNVALQIYDTLLSWWKMGKTVYNIGTHARNVLSNVLFSQLAGNSAWNLGNVRYYREAIHALRNGGRDLLEAYEMGVLGADFVTAELRQTLRQLLPDPATIEDDGKAPGILLGIGRSIGKFIPQALKNPLHRAHNQITALYQAEDEVFKLAAYLKAKSMGLSSEQARDHVRQWFPYFDGGTSMTLKALGRTTMPFLGFYRESIRIFGQAIKERPVALAAGMAIPSLLTLFSAMLLGLDEEDLDEVKQTALRGKASGLLGLTPLDREPLFSILLPWRTEGGNLQQFDLSAIYPFTEMLGERIEGTEGQDWWQRQWRKLITAGPLGSLAYSFGANEDPFSRQPLVEPGMSGWEAFQKRFEHTYQALLPPLTPGIPGLTVGGSNIETLSKSGALPWKDAQRATDKTLQMRSAPEAFVRAVLGLDVRSANPSLYELADAWRKANGYEVNEGTDYGSTTPTSRARKALFKELAQETPNITAIRNISAALKRMGAPVETEQDINRLLFYRDPLKIIGGNKKLGITPQDAQERFRASLKGESRRVLDAALRTFADIKQRAPALLRQANLP